MAGMNGSLFGTYGVGFQGKLRGHLAREDSLGVFSFFKDSHFAIIVKNDIKFIKNTFFSQKKWSFIVIGK